MGKYTSLARALREEPEEATFEKDKGSAQRNTYVNINSKDKSINSNSTVGSSGIVTTLRPTTLTTLKNEAQSEKAEKARVICIHELEPEECAVCSGYVRWLIEDEARLRAAHRNPERMRRRYRESLKGGTA